MDREKIIAMLDELNDSLESFRKNEREELPELLIMTKNFVPSYATEGSAGLDIPCDNDEPIVIEPRTQAKIPTGISVAIPQGYFGAIYPRSSAGIKLRVTLSNTVGIIDSDYRGEISLFVYNEGENPITIHKGDRLVQMILQPYLKANIRVVEELDDTLRGAGGFGSTGLSSSK